MYDQFIKIWVNNHMEPAVTPDPRTNSQVADVFEAIANILQDQGENPFKIRAYRNAVRTLESLPEPVAGIAARGDLKKVPGFGEAIAGKTLEILATGTCELYERLRAEIAAKIEDPWE